MIEDKTYSVERYTAEIDAKVYIEGFRRADYFIKLCQQCGNYGRRYGCPPFDNDSLTAIEGYDTVRILGVKITPKDKSLPLEAANDLMKPVINELNEELLLEAIGFDISKTAQDLLGLEIKWSQNGLIPEYLTLVCGIFYKKHWSDLSLDLLEDEFIKEQIKASYDLVVSKLPKKLGIK